MKETGVCQYCGRVFYGNFASLKKHEAKCEKNPIFQYSENVVMLETGKQYHPTQKVKYVCEVCGKETVCQFQNFKGTKCPHCRGGEKLKERFLNYDWSIRNAKAKQTFLEKYGVENPNQIEQVRQKIEQTNLKKYGVKHVFQAKEVQEKIKQTCLERYGTDHFFQAEEVKEKIRQTQIERYGKWYTSTNEYKQKCEQTCLKKYGVPSHNQAKVCKEKMMQTFLNHYGVDNVRKSVYMAQHRKQRYEYDNIRFDTMPELAFYIYWTDLGKIVEHNSVSFSYFLDGKVHKYFPDFKIDEDLYEIKGDQFLKEDGTWQNPFDHSQDKLFEAKHQCAIKNHVHILYGQDYQKYIDYVVKTYSKDFLEIFKTDLPFPYSNASFTDKSNYGLIRHFHKSIYEANRKGYLSPIEAWKDKNLIKKSALNRLQYVNSCSSKDVLRGFSVAKIAPKVSVFSPSMAAKLIKQYLGEYSTIVDPFSGFSGRLLGSAECGKTYVGKDLNEKHVAESNEIIHYRNLQNCSVVVEDILKKENVEEYDCLFTCPPYEDKEHWNENDMPKTCDEWIDICMKMYKCKKYLFVVDETKKYKSSIVNIIKNKSHFGENYEKIILIEGASFR